MCSINLTAVSEMRVHFQWYESWGRLPLMHEKHMWSTRDVGMACDGENANLIGVVGHISVEVVKVIPPKVFDVSRIDPSMAVGSIFDEHHWWQAVARSYQYYDRPSGVFALVTLTTTLSAMAQMIILSHSIGFTYLVKIPVGGDFHKASLPPFHKRLHPSFRLLFVVDLRPAVSGPQPVHVAVIVGHGVVISGAVSVQFFFSSWEME